MTHFEYLSIAISIIFALSIGRLVVAIPAVVDPKRFDALHFGHFLCLLLVQMQFWWRGWQFSSVTQWDFAGFVMSLSVAMLYYLAAHLLVPMNYLEIGSWRSHFTNVSRWFHGIIGITWAASVGISAYLMNVSFLPPPMPITVLFFTAAIFYQRRWFHFIVLAWWILLLGFITYNLQGGAA